MCLHSLFSLSSSMALPNFSWTINLILNVGVLWKETKKPGKNTLQSIQYQWCVSINAAPQWLGHWCTTTWRPSGESFHLRQVDLKSVFFCFLTARPESLLNHSTQGAFSLFHLRLVEVSAQNWCMALSLQCSFWERFWSSSRWVKGIMIFQSSPEAMRFYPLQ